MYLRLSCMNFFRIDKIYGEYKFYFYIMKNGLFFFDFLINNYKNGCILCFVND